MSSSKRRRLHIELKTNVILYGPENYLPKWTRTEKKNFLTSLPMQILGPFIFELLGYRDFVRSKIALAKMNEDKVTLRSLVLWITKLSFTPDDAKALHPQSLHRHQLHNYVGTLRSIGRTRIAEITSNVLPQAVTLGDIFRMASLKIVRIQPEDKRFAPHFAHEQLQFLSPKIESLHLENLVFDEKILPILTRVGMAKLTHVRLSPQTGFFLPVSLPLEKCLNVCPNLTHLCLRLTDTYLSVFEACSNSAKVLTDLVLFVDMLFPQQDELKGNHNVIQHCIEKCTKLERVKLLCTFSHGTTNIHLTYSRRDFAMTFDFHTDDAVHLLAPFVRFAIPDESFVKRMDIHLSSLLEHPLASPEQRSEAFEQFLSITQEKKIRIGDFLFQNPAEYEEFKGVFSDDEATAFAKWWKDIQPGSVQIDPSQCILEGTAMVESEPIVAAALIKHAGQRLTSVSIKDSLFLDGLMFTPEEDASLTTLSLGAWEPSFPSFDAQDKILVLEDFDALPNLLLRCPQLQHLKLESIAFRTTPIMFQTLLGLKPLRSLSLTLATPVPSSVLTQFQNMQSIQLHCLLTYQVKEQKDAVTSVTILDMLKRNPQLEDLILDVPTNIRDSPEGFGIRSSSLKIFMTRLVSSTVALTHLERLRKDCPQLSNCAFRLGRELVETNRPCTLAERYSSRYDWTFDSSIYLFDEKDAFMDVNDWSNREYDYVQTLTENYRRWTPWTDRKTMAHISLPPLAESSMSNPYELEPSQWMLFMQHLVSKQSIPNLALNLLLTREDWKMVPNFQPDKDVPILLHTLQKQALLAKNSKARYLCCMVFAGYNPRIVWIDIEAKRCEDVFLTAAHQEHALTEDMLSQIGFKEFTILPQKELPWMTWLAYEGRDKPLFQLAVMFLYLHVRMINLDATPLAILSKIMAPGMLSDYVQRYLQTARDALKLPLSGMQKQMTSTLHMSYVSDVPPVIHRSVMNEQKVCHPCDIEVTWQPTPSQQEELIQLNSKARELAQEELEYVREWSKMNPRQIKWDKMLKTMQKQIMTDEWNHIKQMWLTFYTSP